MPDDAARRLRDLNTILAVSRAMGSERDLGRLLDLIISGVTTLVEADRSSLFLVDHQRQELWTTVAQHTTAIRLPLGSGIAGSVARTGQSINIPAAYADERFSPENDRRSGFRTESILCMPLVNYTDKVVGVIQALNKRGGPFSAYDEQVLGALCSQAAVAIDNAQLIASEGERQRMEHELNLAAGIQAGLLPADAPQHPQWRFASFTRPCDQTGGDYYDYMATEAGELDVVVGDVSGHGIGSALLMSTARAFLRALHLQGEPLAAIMTRLNRLLEADMADDTFMSMVACRLRDDGGCTYVAAGHEPPLVWRAATRSFDGLDSTGLLLGLLDAEVYGELALPALAAGDLLVLFTDGMWEAASPAKEQYGIERMKAAIAGAASRGAEAVRDALVDGALRQLAGEAPLDDMTVVVVEKR
jgi:sigma-B regulation protein RsbU (phosphoserine phosphatase)